jgi:hypothetical protein
MLVLISASAAWFSSGCDQDDHPLAMNEPSTLSEAERAVEVTNTPTEPAAPMLSEDTANTGGITMILQLHGEEFDQIELRGQMQTQYGLPEIEPQNLVDLIFANGLLVQAAAEAYAAENGGVYPTSTGSQSVARHTLIDLLPQGTLLRNPVTGLHDSPVNGMAGQPGQVGYLMFDSNADGLPDDYVIDGVDKNGYDQVFVITRYQVFINTH